MPAKQQTERSFLSAPRVLLASLVLAGSSGCALLVDIGGPREKENEIAVGTGSNEPDKGAKPSQGEGAPAAPSSTAPPPACTADLATDPANCGFCGHDCGGQKCNAGLCDPVTIVQASFVRALAVDEDRVFYTTDRDVRSCPAVASATCANVATADLVSTAVRSGTGSNTTVGGIKIGVNFGGGPDEGSAPALDPRALALFGDRFFVADETYDTVFACPKTGCSSQAIATVRPDSDPDFGGGLFVDAAKITWSEKGGIGEAPLPQPGTRVDGVLFVDPVARDVKRVLVGLVGGVDQLLFRGADGVFAAEPGALPSAIYATTPVRDFAADTKFAYVATTSSIVRVDRATRAQAPIAQLPAGSELERVIADGAGVYATTYGGPLGTRIVRVREGGLDVLAITSEIGVIGLTSKWLYYAGNGAIRRVAR
jgi:hypothetical protein